MARPHILTARGAAVVDTSQKQFGSGSAKFANVTDWIDTPDDTDFAFGSADFTIEQWVRFAGTPANNNGLASQWGGAGSRAFVWYYTQPSGGLEFDYSVLGTTVVTLAQFAWVPVATTWYHVAISRSGTNLRAFVDGTQVGSTYTIATGIFDSSAVFTIGTDGGTVLDSFGGNVDEFRVSNIARYTGTFTPSASAFVNDANTVLLVHCDGTNGSTTFTDDNAAAGGTANNLTLLGVGT